MRRACSWPYLTTSCLFPMMLAPQNVVSFALLFRSCASSTAGQRLTSASPAQHRSASGNPIQQAGAAGPEVNHAAVACHFGAHRLAAGLYRLPHSQRRLSHSAWTGDPFVCRAPDSRRIRSRRAVEFRRKSGQRPGSRGVFFRKGTTLVVPKRPQKALTRDRAASCLPEARSAEALSVAEGEGARRPPFTVNPAAGALL